MALPSSRVITLIDIGLSVNEHYVQFVPPATFGVIYDSALKTIQLVRANGQRTLLRKTGDKMYTLRGFLGLRRRECKRLELRWEIEDEIIRCVLTSFGSLEKLKAAVWKYCPNTENAEVITQLWAPEVFDAIELDETEQELNSFCSPAELDTSLAGARHIPPATHLEERDFARLGLLPVAPYMERSPALFDHTPDSQSLQASKLSTVGDKEMDFSMTTSLQEHEEFTLPPVSSLPVSFSFPQIPTAFVNEDQSSDIRVKQTEVPQEILAYDQSQSHTTTMPLPYHKPVHSKYRFRRLPLPIATLFPNHQTRWQVSAPSPLRPVQGQSGNLQRAKMETTAYRETEDEILKEIQTSASLEVLRTRCPSSDRKIEIATSLISRLGLPEDYFIVGKCYRAIDTGIEDHTRSMKEYFLKEGQRYKDLHPQEAYTSSFPREMLSNHACNICDHCLWRFFVNVRLSNLIGSTSVLTDSYLRSILVKFYGCALQLGIKAAWDPEWKERAFDPCFYSLDKITVNLEFSGPHNAQTHTTSENENCGEQRKRRRIY